MLVDVRRESPTHGKWEAFEFNDVNHHQLLVPIGFGHGFCVVSEVADVRYKQTAYNDPAVERGFACNDPDVGIDWPLPAGELIPSQRDASAPLLRDLAKELPFTY